MIADQHAISQVTGRGKLGKDVEEQFGRQFLDGRSTMEVVHVDVHLAIPEGGKSADGGSRVVRMHHKIGVVVERSRRRVGAV